MSKNLKQVLFCEEEKNKKKKMSLSYFFNFWNMSLDRNSSVHMAMGCAIPKAPMFRVGFLLAKSTLCKNKKNQVGIRTNLPDLFQLCSKELNPCDRHKGLIPPSQEKG